MGAIRCGECAPVPQFAGNLPSAVLISEGVAVANWTVWT